MPDVDETKEEPKVFMVRLYDKSDNPIVSAYVDEKIARALPYNIKTQRFTDFFDIKECHHLILNEQVGRVLFMPVDADIYNRYRASVITPV